jgi:hypothetical protein
VHTFLSVKLAVCKLLLRCNTSVNLKLAIKVIIQSLGSNQCCYQFIACMLFAENWPRRVYFSPFIRMQNSVIDDMVETACLLQFERDCKIEILSASDIKQFRWQMEPAELRVCACTPALANHQLNQSTNRQVYCQTNMAAV